MPHITLQSSDGKIFNIAAEIAKKSVFLEVKLERWMNVNDGGESVPTHLPINAAILKKVIQWAENHKADPPSLDNPKNKVMRTYAISSWDSDFLKEDQGTIFSLILAANYLDIEGLLHATCKSVANMMKGRSANEIREIFNIQNDFTSSEEKQVRKICG